MLKILFAFFLLITLSYPGVAQRLHARQPVELLQDHALTSSISITQYKHHYFAAWTEKQSANNIRVAHLGSDRDTLTAHVGTIGKTVKAVSSPQLCGTPKGLFLLWATANNKLYYCRNTSDTGFMMAETRLLDIPASIEVKRGFAATPLSNGVAVTCIDKNKSPVVIIAQQDSSTSLRYKMHLPIYSAKTDVAPSGTVIAQDVLRCCWTDHNTHQLHFADLNLSKKSWSPVTKLSDSKSNSSPIVCRPFNDRRIYYFWKTSNSTITYIQEVNNQRSAPQLLDLGLTGIKSISISLVDHNNFLMACNNGQNGFQLNYLSSYNPASWINDIFFPDKMQYRLSDIVIPGAHDAGMSVLNGVGGRDKHYVNRCNTLTQLLNVDAQLKAGIRMFDIRLGVLNGVLYTKHAPAGCMEESKGGGWGEKLSDILNATKSFLDSNRNEFVILNFSHFCDHPLSIQEQASQIAARLGEKYIYDLNGKYLPDTKLSEVTGKVVLLFENNAFPDLKVFGSTAAMQSPATVNFKGEYAKTDNLKSLIEKEQAFFSGLRHANRNDLIRLDWQLTERSSEAALVCNVFRVERYMPIVDGLVWLTNTLERNKSILNLAMHGNKSLIPQMHLWINQKLINRNNKPNILYIDAAGSWITDYCIELNQSSLYSN